MGTAESVFNIIPDVEALINFGKFEKEITIPTKIGITTIKLQLLWEGEEYEIVKDSAKDSDTNDMLSRTRFMVLETLVKAITKISEKEYTSKDKDENETLKNELRMVLTMSNPKIIKYLYWVYTELIKYRDEFVDKETDKVKKKFTETLRKLKPL